MENKKTFDKSSYDQQYIKNNIIRKVITFNKLHDQELIEYIKDIKNLNKYIKNLIIKDMKENLK